MRSDSSFHQSWRMFGHAQPFVSDDVCRTNPQDYTLEASSSQSFASSSYRPASSIEYAAHSNWAHPIPFALSHASADPPHRLLQAEDDAQTSRHHGQQAPTYVQLATTQLSQPHHRSLPSIDGDDENDDDGDDEDDEEPRPTAPARTAENNTRSAKKKCAPKRRSTKACDSCRRQKCKCEPDSKNSKTCSQCALLGQRCTYNDQSKKRGPPKGYIEAIETRLHHMESILYELMHSPEPDGRSILERLVGKKVMEDIWSGKIVLRMQHDPDRRGTARASSGGKWKHSWWAAPLDAGKARRADAPPADEEDGGDGGGASLVAKEKAASTASEATVADGPSSASRSAQRAGTSPLTALSTPSPCANGTTAHSGPDGAAVSAASAPAGAAAGAAEMGGTSASAEHLGLPAAAAVPHSSSTPLWPPRSLWATSSSGSASGSTAAFAQSFHSHAHSHSDIVGHAGLTDHTPSTVGSGTVATYGGGSSSVWTPGIMHGTPASLLETSALEGLPGPGGDGSPVKPMAAYAHSHAHAPNATAAEALGAHHFQLSQSQQQHHQHHQQTSVQHGDALAFDASWKLGQAQVWSDPFGATAFPPPARVETAAPSWMNHLRMVQNGSLPASGDYGMPALKRKRDTSADDPGSEAVGSAAFPANTHPPASKLTRFLEGGSNTTKASLNGGGGGGGGINAGSSPTRTLSHPRLSLPGLSETTSAQQLLSLRSFAEQQQQQQQQQQACSFLPAVSAATDHRANHGGLSGLGFGMGTPGGGEATASVAGSVPMGRQHALSETRTSDDGGPI